MTGDSIDPTSLGTITSLIVPAYPSIIDTPSSIAYDSAPAVAVASVVATTTAPEKAAASSPVLGVGPVLTK